MIEKPQYGLTWFRIRFGLLQLKACTKGEHVLRCEATVHNTREPRCRRGLENFPEIIGRLAGLAERFCTTVDCAAISFLSDRALDELPLPSRVGATRTGGLDLNKPRLRAALLALRDQGIAPILAGIRSPRRGRKPAHWTVIDRDSETLRIGVQALFHNLGITPVTLAVA